MKNLILLSLILLLINGCSESNDTIDEEVVVDPVIETFTITGEYTPGDIIQIKSNKTLLLSSIDVVLNNSTIKAYQMNEFTYVFTLPVIPSGKYNVKLPTIDKNLILNLTVKAYTPIANPTEVIAAYIVTRNKCFEEMTKNTSVVQSPTSIETLLMIDQIKQEWEYQYSLTSEKDKELLAYILQKQQISPDWFNFSDDFPADYYNKWSASEIDAGDHLVSIAKTFVTFQVICVGSIPFVIGSGAVFLLAPNPFSAGVFLISFSTFVIAKEVAKRKAMDVGSLKGVAEAVTDFYTQKTAALELINNVEKNIGMNVNFRNLKSTDATIQADINTAFIGESELVAKDNEVKVLYQKAVQFTSKLKRLFPSYIPALGKTSERNIVIPILGSDIIIKGSSEPSVTITSKIVGNTTAIKVSSSSTQNINFNLKVAYKRKIDGQEVVKDIACVFKPSTPCEDTTAFYPTIAIGTQVWMQKNLNVCKYRNGDDIPQVTDPTQWRTLTTGAWCYYENNTEYGTVYGKLYNWYAVNDPRGLAPTGYHIPNNSEWNTLGDFFGGGYLAGPGLKSTTLWTSSNETAIPTNSSGFSGLPGGGRQNNNGTFFSLGTMGNWWSSTSYQTGTATIYAMFYNEGGIGYRDWTKGDGYSVRCVKD